MERERAFFLDPTLGSFERPYGWGWYLTLAAEASRSESGPATRWAELLRPLAETLEAKFLSWLPKLTYPQRVGMHQNTAFALTLARPWALLRADEGNSDLLDEIEMSAFRFFLRDVDYPAHYEPSGADFLSAGLTEAVLMRHVLHPSEFASWFDRLPSSPARRTAFDPDSSRSLGSHRWANRTPARLEHQPRLGVDGPGRRPARRRSEARHYHRIRRTASGGIHAIRRGRPLRGRALAGRLCHAAADIR